MYSYEPHIQLLQSIEVHTDRVKKLVTERGCPHTFMSCSEDGAHAAAACPACAGCVI